MSNSAGRTARHAGSLPRGAAIRNDEGRITGLRGTVIDITERKQTELQNAILGRATIAGDPRRQDRVWEMDVRTGRVIGDGSMPELYGLHPSTRENPTLDLWLSTLHPEDRATASRAFERCIADHTPFDTDFRVVTPARRNPAHPRASDIDVRRGGARRSE